MKQDTVSARYNSRLATSNTKKKHPAAGPPSPTTGLWTVCDLRRHCIQILYSQLLRCVRCINARNRLRNRKKLISKKSRPQSLAAHTLPRRFSHCTFAILPQSQLPALSLRTSPQSLLPKKTPAAIILRPHHPGLPHPNQPAPCAGFHHTFTRLPHPTDWTEPTFIP